ncbi:2-phosphosulfolactate phosphatase [Rosettibacter firmus]|uniref:2-phosphosulfolactate phosphatase n=1 Tax=Rosettibacter firmus TaxID=3111522 RepID=UPI00336BCE3E
MKINVLFSNIFLDELYFTGKTTVIIDVLRASSVITTALSNGAREIVPVSTLDFAMKISSDAFKSQTLLCGERNTRMVEGFNLGNSPLEYKPEIVAGKSIILYTTNGSKSIVKAKFSENLFIGCFLNLPALARHLMNLNLDFEIVCAGTNGLFNLEDAVCAGMLINEIQTQLSDIQLSDSAVASVILSKQLNKNLYSFLCETEHGKLLIENGFLDDIIECSKYGITDVIPYFVSGAIKRL